MTNAPQRDVEFIKLHPGEFPGVSVLDTSTRSYPDGGSVAAQILGYVGPITEQEIAQNPHAGYQPDSTIGKSGIESYYEQYLRGKQGTSTLEVNANGQTARRREDDRADRWRLGRPQYRRPPADRRSRTTSARRSSPTATPSTRVSDKVPEAINGAAIVMNPNNGEVYAMASYPSYNLNSFVNGLSDAAYKQLNTEGAFNNYAIQGLYTPGSTFKLVTATTELQTGIFPADKLIDDTGTFTVPGCRKRGVRCVFHDDDNEAAGDIDLPTALTVSSDYYFYNLGYLFWSQQAKYGQTPIQNVAGEYGLTSPPTSTCPMRRRVAWTRLRCARSSTRRTRRRSRTRPGTPATTSRWPSARDRRR